MTHEELLAKIEIRIADFCDDEKDFCDVCSPWKALRAVVKLHNPFQFEDGIDEYKPVCSHCQLGVVGDIYPCETIEAIEKELR